MLATRSGGSPAKYALNAAILSVFAVAAGSAFADEHRGISQSGEQKNMRRVGHVDLQGRPSYQPNVIVYPDGRTTAFAGTHGGSKPNTLKPGSPVELNGVVIIDATDPSRPVEKFHIPVPAAGGQSQSVRMCLGSDLPKGVPGRVYLLRNVQGSAASGYEVWDVTNVSNPTLAGEMRGLRNTHKMWWECKTGVAYLPGSRDVPAPNRWRQGQSMVVADWSDPAHPQYIRTFGLPGGQPGATGPMSTSLHGAISTHEHPKAADRLTRGATADDVIGNRIYTAWGVGDDGVLQILDRKKLLPPSLGGTWTGDPDKPSEADLLAPQVARLDIVLLASEATADLCQEAPHFSFIVDVTVENSRTAPPGTRLQQNAWQGPMVLSSMSVDPRAGEKFPRGNYCKRGARFGVHSSEENFRNPFYGRLTFLAYFTGGVRAWDIREPQAPVEVGFYVPVANANTVQPDGYMSNNVEVDNRGFIFVTDRNGSGLDILELRGKARSIGLGKDRHGDDGDDD